jgi:hypothetical protein
MNRSLRVRPEVIVNEYCFSLVSPQRSEFDFRLGQFPSAEHALQLAELIASDLSIEAESKWSGWTMAVRNPHGRQLFSITLPDSEIAAPR